MSPPTSRATPFAARSDLGWRVRRVWRGRLRPLWKEVRAPLVLLLALAVIVLGTIGFSKPAGGGLEWWEGLIKSVQLFGFAGGDVSSESPLTLNIARLLGPLLVGYAAIRGLLLLSREQIRRLGFRFLRRNHVVVAGLGDVGFRLAATLNEAGARVIALDRDPTHPSIEGCRERGIGTLIGDATDVDVLRAVRVDRAKYLIVTPGVDSVAIDVIAAATEAAGERASNPLLTYAHIEDRALWQAMAARSLVEGRDPDLRIELFNLYEVAARLLLDEHPPFAAGANGAGPAPILLVADEALAEILILNMARLWRNARSDRDQLVELTVAGPDASAICERAYEQHEGLRNVCRLSPVDGDPGGRRLYDLACATRFAAIYVALADEARGLASALQLAQAPGPPAPLTLVINDERLGAATLAGGARERRAIEIFGILSRALAPDLMLQGLNETLAREMHASYRRNQIARGADPADSRLVAWDELSDDLKSSNRAFADGIPEKMAAVGFVAVPSALVDLDGVDSLFAPDEVEALAVLEHERWVRDRARDGWSFGATRDDARKLHPSMVPWEDLSEPEREKDRDAVRDLPRILAEAGFEVHRVRPAG